MIGRDAGGGRGDALPDVLGPLGQAVDRPARGLQHLAGAADQLPGHQERDEDVGQPAELAVAGHQVVLVTAVGVAGRVGVVLEQVDVAGDALVVQPLLGVDEQPFEDALAGPVVGDQVGHRVALRRRVLRVGAHVQVQPRAVAQEHVARPPPRDHPTEQVAGHLVRAQPPLPPVGAGDPVLGLESEDAPVHGMTVPARTPESSCPGPAGVTKRRSEPSPGSLFQQRGQGRAGDPAEGPPGAAAVQDRHLQQLGRQRTGAPALPADAAQPPHRQVQRGGQRLVGAVLLADAARRWRRPARPSPSPRARRCTEPS